jgi:hypothetical protein
VHEFEVESRGDLQRTFAYATVPAGSYPDSASANGLRDAAGKGDFRLIDITNPQAPFEVSTWKVQQAGGPFAAQRCDPDGNYGHGHRRSERLRNQRSRFIECHDGAGSSSRVGL